MPATLLSGRPAHLTRLLSGRLSRLEYRPGHLCKITSVTTERRKLAIHGKQITNP